MDQVKIRCLIVDDEPLAIDKISAFIRKLPILEETGAYTNALEAFNHLKSKDVDLLFLDIQMEDLSGIQLLEILKRKPYVVITSAYSEYALKGFELDVADYLLKPISFERFMQSVEKVVDRMAQARRTSEILTPGQRHTTAGADRTFVLIKTDYHMERVCFDQIQYIEGMKDYLGIITPEKRIMTLMSFAALEELLPPRDFFRIHKSYVIALAKIERIERNQVIINKERIPIGETYRKSFFSRLKDLGITN
jgi:two-component system, LytTR family, response regulator